jgi:hypothetical protein
MVTSPSGSVDISSGAEATWPADQTGDACSAFMSIAAMNWAWRQQLAPAAKLVPMSLADAANDYGICWPSVPTVARKCGVSSRTVRRIMSVVKQNYPPVVTEFSPPSSMRRRDYDS